VLSKGSATQLMGGHPCRPFTLESGDELADLLRSIVDG
jgi:hypothetical protein